MGQPKERDRSRLLAAQKGRDVEFRGRFPSIRGEGEKRRLDFIFERKKPFSSAGESTSRGDK